MSWNDGDDTKRVLIALVVVLLIGIGIGVVFKIMKWLFIIALIGGGAYLLYRRFKRNIGGVA